MSTIGEIFDIPEAVHQGDFVLRLTEGLQTDRRQQTLDQYVVTPQLVQSFVQALSLIGSAVTSNSSKGAYLHGSFGSGKSHFMAVLDMILEGDARARAIPALAEPIRKANAWWEGGKYLMVPFHMIGAKSMEAAILGGYAAYVRAKHPDAPTPGFYRSAELIANADRLREQMGGDSFFAAMDRNSRKGDGWGAMGSGWDADTYVAAAKAPPESKQHRSLVGDLVDAFFTHLKFDADADNYVSLDHGLAVMSQHAKNLGYRAVVLFLDELILWLASHSQDQAFLNREGQKVSKLVEAESADRPIPIVSFIARQRDLRELVGKSVPGAQQLAFADVLQWWEARFDKITLDDRNLPAIIERRLLRVKGPEQEAELHAAFERTATVRREVLDTLLTRTGDKQMFGQVYPFSPALVQVLVALSGLLQRERTALKLMLQLLVQNRDRLMIGDVIPVGDLFDVIIDGDEPFTPAIKNLFDSARKLWAHKLMPLLEAEYDVADVEVRDGSADPAVARRYLTDAGLMKTLLLSALAPDVEALHGLTPLRLAALNHGTIRSPLPNAEASTVLNKVRAWASHVGEIQLSDDAANPIISLQLSGVDVEGIIENARNNDNPGNRQRAVKEMLFGDIGIDTTVSTVFAPEYEWLWRGSKRRADVLFHNIRICTDENLRPSQDNWRLVVDYPFDEEPGYGPADDRARLNEFRNKHEPVRTLAWVPSFLNDRALTDLGRLVVLNHVLQGNRLDEYAAHLSPADRQAARATLNNQRNQLDQRMRSALKQVYGIAHGAASDVDSSHTLDEHFQSLADGLSLQPPPGGDFKGSVEHLLGQALDHQFPAHPQFPVEVRRSALKHALDVLCAAVDAPDGRAGSERRFHDEVRAIVEPLNLATCGEAHVALSDHWRNHFTRMMGREGVSVPSVSQLRQWMDDPQPMGLADPVSDLVILTWAAQTGRTPFLHGAAVNGDIGSLNREYELREQALPDEAVWQRAVQRAADLFGEVGTGAGRHPGNVAAMVTALRTQAAGKLTGTQNYQRALSQRAAEWNIDADAPRRQTADACLAMLTALAANDNDPVLALADATLATSAAAMAAVMARADQLTRALTSSEWDVLKTFRDSGKGGDAAATVVDAVHDVLRNDEHVTALAAIVSAQHKQALALLAKPAPASVPPSPTSTTASTTAPKVSGSARHISRQSLNHAAALATLQEIGQALANDATLRANIDCTLYHVGDEDRAP